MGPVRLELTTFALKGRYSHQLNYGPDNKGFIFSCQCAWWSLNHSLRIPRRPLWVKWCVPVPKVDLAVGVSFPHRFT